eukprot:gnl/MRDRNA2_/MRDRNA2_70729_c0_seq1.p1 gnl/MRDRNA2_/MRDRNA2_70729_c0~~gnl/MRDRNA2_/MRDRNA2_70729_c0_seq1.p1  ORF type:complete len:484 (-),score=118.35 gnl/MRDRNA2_/MRDRNA2_70729_c0_seq1:22-1473(-)
MNGRQLIRGNKRCNGTIYDWKGHFGWIEPDQAIPHPDAVKNGGRIYIQQSDVTSSKGPLKKGDKVTFVVYRDNKGLGAQDMQVRVGAQTPQPSGMSAKTGVMKTIGKEKWKGQASSAPPPKAKAPGASQSGKGDFGKGSSKGASQGQQQQQASKGASKGAASSSASTAKPAGASFQNKPAVPKLLQMNAKASSKGASKGQMPKAVQQHQLKQNQNQQKKPEANAAGPSKAHRLRVIGGKRIRGAITKWGGPPSGRFGWVKPSQKLEHGRAHEREGLLYLHETDCASGQGQSMHVGAQVEFFVYADLNGLGAEDCKKIGSSASGAAKPAGPAQKAGASPAKASPAKAATPNNQAKGQGKGGWGTPMQSNSIGSAASSQKNQNQNQTKGNQGWSWNQGSTSKTPAVQQQQQQKGVQQTQWQKNKTPQTQAKTQQTQKKWGSDKPPQPAGKPPLPPNWEEHWSDEHGVPYYWNNKTKKSVWIKPTS